VRFTHEGVRHKISTKERDSGRASLIAARIYAEHVTGSSVPAASTPAAPAPPTVSRATAERMPDARSLLGVDELGDKWLEAIEPELDERTVRGYRLYVHTHWMPFFQSLGDITTARADAYTRMRLRAVRRKTILKELSALRRFLDWAVTEGLLDTMPTVRSPARTATGTDYLGGARKKVRVELTEDEAEAVLANLPEHSKIGEHPVRAFFTVAYETSLRRGTLTALVAPGDYTPGRATLRIRDEIDKARFGRELPISERARAALDSVCPKKGLLFPQADYRSALEPAARAAGLSPDRARHLSYHDWRHAALTHLASATTDLAGMAYLAGHKDVTTTAKYVHANIKAAERALAARATKK
jgi:integrase